MLRKYDIFYEDVAAASVATGEDFHGSVGGDLAKRMQQKRRQSMRWLKIVFWGTLALFLLELLLAWAATAVTLLADAAHSGSDVISYGIGWMVEWWKSASRLPGKKKGVSIQTAAETADLIDTGGCIASVLTLLLATMWAAAEAWRELHLPSKGKPLVGSALLFFAIASSIINIGMLQMRPRRKNTEDKTSNQADLPSRRNLPESELKAAVVDMPDPPVYCMPCSLQEVYKPVETQNQPAQGGDDESISLHMFFHPGCDCAAGGNWCPDDFFSNTQNQPDASTEKIRSFNLTAAKLHLFSDMFRSLLILVVALAIQLGIVQDAKHADAMCGLVVAVLIVIGSVALMLRVAGHLKSFWRKTSLRNPSVAKKEYEEQGQCFEPQKPVARIVGQPDV